MVRHDLQTVPEDELLHDQDTAESAEGVIEAREDSFREQMQISERLNEYYVQVVAEIRASLERVEAEGG
jgi:CRISPR/Cas system-associated exonuclease Cas4 (RecB family)